MSFQFFVMLRLLSSFSLTVASSMSFAALLGNFNALYVYFILISINTYFLASVSFENSNLGDLLSLLFFGLHFCFLVLM